MVRHGISVYGCANQTNMEQVQSILNFCARVMTGRRKFAHISDVVNQNPALNVRQPTIITLLLWTMSQLNSLLR